MDFFSRSPARSLPASTDDNFSDAASELTEHHAASRGALPVVLDIECGKMLDQLSIIARARQFE